MKSTVSKFANWNFAEIRTVVFLWLSDRLIQTWPKNVNGSSPELRLMAASPECVGDASAYTLHPSFVNSQIRNNVMSQKKESLTFDLLFNTSTPNVAPVWFTCAVVPHISLRCLPSASSSSTSLGCSVVSSGVVTRGCGLRGASMNRVQLLSASLMSTFTKHPHLSYNAALLRERTLHCRYGRCFSISVLSLSEFIFYSSMQNAQKTNYVTCSV